jgi:hypothetical protein
VAARGRSAADDALVTALASGATVAAAAQLADVGERTVYRRLRDPDFRARVERARADLVERALGHLAQGAAEAAITLRNLLAAPDDRVKRGAARAVLELGSKLRETVELSGQVEELRRQVEELSHGNRHSSAEPDPEAAADADPGAAGGRPAA